jgi:parallel beta-helix repeat protein
MRRRAIFLIASCVMLLGLLCIANSYALTLYVNGATGFDGPGHGTTPDDPYRTIKYALSRAIEGTTISVASGIYKETLKITQNLITLKGAGRTTTTINGNGTAPTVEITGPVRVTIRGFSITGGKPGIQCEFAFLTSIYNTIKNNLLYGLIAAESSYALMQYTIVESNPERGVMVSLSSSAVIENSTIRQNQNGVWIDLSSSAILRSNKINSNVLRGIMLANSSSSLLTGNEIYGNGYSGIQATNSSTVNLQGKNKIYSDGGSGGSMGGISIVEGSVLQVGLVAPADEDTIYSNKGPGIFITNNGHLYLWGGTVSANKGDGVSLRNGASAEFEESATIKDNTGWGYSCDGTNPISGVPVTSGNGEGITNCH